MKRPTRILAAVLALLGVLFAQLAVASYACPLMVAPVQMAATMPDGGCDGMPMDPEQPALCHAHAQQGNQSLDKPIVSLPQPTLLQGLVSDWGADPGIPHGSTGDQRSLLSRATVPPVALRHCCLRI